MKKEMVRKRIVSAAAAAVGAFLVWAGFDIYDRMTESAEECALKARIIQRERPMKKRKSCLRRSIGAATFCSGFKKAAAASARRT